MPARHPQIAWRGGVDLNPLDVADEDEMAWLANLVWPEQAARRARLREGIAIARREPPTIVRGDLRLELPGLLRQACEHGVPVVFHSAGATHWVSNEAPAVLPGVTQGLDVPVGRFVLGLDGRPAWPSPTATGTRSTGSDGGASVLSVGPATLT